MSDHGTATTRESETRPFYWSVRREIWEHRSITIAPLVVTALALFGSFITALTLPMKDITSFDPDRLVVEVGGSLIDAPALVMFATFLVGVFYALDALYGERRDRSILFWKSLPVADRTTVLSKAAIPLVVLPLVGWVLSLVTFLFALLMGTMVLAAKGVNPAPLWSGLLVQQPLLMFYGLAVHVLWLAPVQSWLLLISAWARRLPLLWAGLPPLAIIAFEKMVHGRSFFALLLAHRLGGAMLAAYHDNPKATFIHRFSQLDPVGFLGAPGLWIGLIFAAAFLAAAVRLRRNREPI